MARPCPKRATSTPATNHRQARPTLRLHPAPPRQKGAPLPGTSRAVVWPRPLLEPLLLQPHPAMQSRRVSLLRPIRQEPKRMRGIRDGYIPRRPMRPPPLHLPPPRRPWPRSTSRSLHLPPRGQPRKPAGPSRPRRRCRRKRRKRPRANRRPRRRQRSCSMNHPRRSRPKRRPSRRRAGRARPQCLRRRRCLRPRPMPPSRFRGGRRLYLRSPRPCRRLPRHLRPKLPRPSQRPRPMRLPSDLPISMNGATRAARVGVHRSGSGSPASGSSSRWWLGRPSCSPACLCPGAGPLHQGRPGRLRPGRSFRARALRPPARPSRAPRRR